MAQDLRVPMAPIVDAFGVGAVIHTNEGESIDATVVWLPDETLESPPGGPYVRRESRREMAILRSDLGTAGIGRGTRIDAPVERGEAVTGWQVDSEVHREWDHVHVTVIPDPQWQGE